MAPLPESESTLRAVTANRAVPWPEAFRIVSDVAHELVERHRRGSAHGAVGLDTITVDASGAVRLLPPPAEAAEGGAAAAYGRDTQALGELLLALGKRTTGMPEAATRLATRTTEGAVVTPAAFAAELAALRPRLAAPHHRVLRHHYYTDSSIEDLFGGPRSDRDDGPPATIPADDLADGDETPTLPPELDPRRPARRSRGAPVGRVVAAVLAAMAVLAALILAVVVLPNDDNGPAGSGNRTTASPRTTPSPSGSSTVSARRVRIVGASAYDPDGDGTENDAEARLAIDGRPSTAWTTVRYATPALGGLKPGVGLIVRLGRSVTPRTIRIVFGVAGSSARVYVGSSRGALLHTPAVARVSHAPAQVTLTAHGGRTGRLLLIWLTALPPSTSGGGYRGSIAGVTVTASR